MPIIGAIRQKNSAHARGGRSLIRWHLLDMKIVPPRFPQAAPQEVWKAPKTGGSLNQRNILTTDRSSPHVVPKQQKFYVTSCRLRRRRLSREPGSVRHWGGDRALRWRQDQDCPLDRAAR